MVYLSQKCIDIILQNGLLLTCQLQTTTAKAKLEESFQKHQEEKVLSRTEKDVDKEKAKNSEIQLAVYDVQAVLPVPIGQTSVFFYKSRLNCYNFTLSFKLHFYYCVQNQIEALKYSFFNFLLCFCCR